MACFADVSQGSVATYARFDGIFNIHLTANLLRNLPVKIFLSWLRFDRIMVISLWPGFFGPLCTCTRKCRRRLTVNLRSSVCVYVCVCGTPQFKMQDLWLSCWFCDDSMMLTLSSLVTLDQSHRHFTVRRHMLARY